MNAYQPLIVEEFISKVGKIPYKAHGIFPSEMFLFYKLAHDFGSQDEILESGTGLSTLMLSKLFPMTPITTVDMNLGRLFTCKIAGVKAVNGDSMTMLPKLLRNSSAQRVAILIDGPKNEQAVMLASALYKEPRVKFVAVHDLPDSMRKCGKFHTRCEEYRAAYGHLDNDVGEYLNRYPVGPGLTIFTDIVDVFI